MTLFLAIWFTFGLFTVGLALNPTKNTFVECLVTFLFWPLILGGFLQDQSNK
jgi:hypothetical protein